MAKAEKKKETKKSLPKNVKGKSSILLVVFSLAAIAIIPTTIMLAIGMLPTLVAGFIDRSKERTKVLTVGFMNFAGVFPFWFQMVEKGHTISAAVETIGNAAVIVMIYGAALGGYIIEWGVVQLTASAMVQRAKLRIGAIRKSQDELIRRFGPEVTGEMPLDQNGFPVEQPKA